ncbi:WXG100 family type VII secretion target [Mycobacterium sp. NPDC003449]
MSIDTKVEGNPAAVRSTAEWLRSTLATKISSTVDQIHSARTTATGDWQGDAGDAFVARMTNGATKADGLDAAAVDGARAIDDFAADLQRAQSEMQSVRDKAASAGLTVDGFIIQDPAPVTQEKINAYATALDGATAAREIEKFAADTLKNAWADISSKWFFVVADLINGAAGALVAVHVSTLLEHSKFMADESAKFLDLAKSAPPGTPAAQIYRDFDQSRVFANTADDAAKAAASAEAKAGPIGLKVGGALAVGGIAYDIANGKDVDQAIVSGGAGFGASVLAGTLTGAAIGSAIPVPGVGTAAGAVVGAAVGIFTSGAVDSLYQNGIGSVGQAISDGAAAVSNTGKAIGGLAEDAWDAIF